MTDIDNAFGGGDLAAMLLYIDDATSSLMQLWFFDGESTRDWIFDPSFREVGFPPPWRVARAQARSLRTQLLVLLERSK